MPKLFWAIRPATKTPAPRGEMAESLLLAEYETVRAESMQSFQNAQSIIQWSMAAYGVLFGAGLVALTGTVTEEYREFVSVAPLIIFSVVLPGLVCAATWQWLGEISRMERAGSYLRGLETHIRNRVDIVPVAGLPGALNWETFLKGTTKTRKRHLPYLGTAGMFAGALAASIGFSVFWQIGVFGADLGTSMSWAWFVWDGLIAGTFLTVSIMSGVGVLSMGKEEYDLVSQRMRMSKDVGSAAHPGVGG